MNNFSLKAVPFDSETVTNPKTGQEEYDRVAHSKDLADLVRAYFSNGILVQGSDLLTNELQVLHLSAMSCVVKPGGIIINGRTGFLENEQTLEFDVGTQNPRIDRVVAELNIAERNIFIKVLKGIAEADPKPIVIMQTEDIYQIPLAQVRINANQSVIASVTDDRAGYISNVLLNQAPRTDVQAAEIKISEAIRNLYGLTADNGNVEKALQRISPKTEHVVEIISSQAWVSPITGKIDVFLVGGGGGGGGNGTRSDYWGTGGGGGGCSLFENIEVTQGQNVSCVIGAGGVSQTKGGDTFFGSYKAVGGLPGSNSTTAADVGGAGTGGGGGIGYANNLSGGNGTLGEPGRIYTASIGALNNMIGSHSGYCHFNKKGYASGGGGHLGLGGDSNAGIGGANNGNGGNAVPNTGCGGGGAKSGISSALIGGTGGSGIIIMRYWT